MHGSFIRNLRLIYIKSRDIKYDVIHRLAADYIFTSRRSLKKKKAYCRDVHYFTTKSCGQTCPIGLPNAHNCHVTFIFARSLTSKITKNYLERSIFRASPYVVHRTNVHACTSQRYIHIIGPHRRVHTQRRRNCK